MSTMRRPPKTVRIVTRPGSPRPNAADDRSAAPKRMRAHGGERGLRLVGRRDGDDLALVGEIERVEPQNLAERLDLFADRRRLFVDLDRHLRGLGDLVQRRRQPAAGRVAQEAHAGRSGDQRRDQSVQRRAIALNRRLQRHVAARA